MNFEEQISWGNLVNAIAVRTFTHNCEIVIFEKELTQIKSTYVVSIKL